MEYEHACAIVTAALSGRSVSNGTRTVVINSVSTVMDEGPHEYLARINLQFQRTAI